MNKIFNRKSNNKSNMSKKLLCIALTFLMIMVMSGCNAMGNSKKTYSNYVKGILDANYKAEFEDYIAITGVSEAEAQKVYDDGIGYLADALMTAYGVNDVEGSDIKAQFEELAREIYSHAKYEITSVDKVDGIYTVTITIYPIDILVITYDDVTSYIENMNTKVSNGDYNHYELDDYEIEYAEGIVQILTNALPNIGNTSGTEVTVTILDNDEYYYISDADFIELDKAILATISVNEDGTVNTSDSENTDAESEITDSVSEE